MHDRRLALLHARKWTTSWIATCLNQAQTGPTAFEFTVYAVAGVTRESLNGRRWRAYQCRGVHPRAACGGERSG